MMEITKTIEASEQKSALVLMGSPRPKGVTAKLLQCFLDQWNTCIDQQERVTIIDAYKVAIKPCIHCGYCKHTQGCAYDDFRIIDRALQETDLLVIASPVYFFGFPAPLKAIFDRTQQYFEAKFSLGMQKPIHKHKYALFLTTFGSQNPRGVMMMQEQLRLIFLLMNASLERTIIAPYTDKVPLDLETIQEEMKGGLMDIKAKW